MAMISLNEAKTYLRVDSDDEDELIRRLSDSAQKLCMSVARIDDEAEFEQSCIESRIAVLYALGYLFEHREQADHHELTLTLRSLLFGVRRECF